MKEKNGIIQPYFKSNSAYYLCTASYTIGIKKGQSLYIVFTYSKLN